MAILQMKGNIWTNVHGATAENTYNEDKEKLTDVTYGLPGESGDKPEPEPQDKVYVHHTIIRNPDYDYELELLFQTEFKESMNAAKLQELINRSGPELIMGYEYNHVNNSYRVVERLHIGSTSGVTYEVSYKYSGTSTYGNLWIMEGYSEEIPQEVFDSVINE